MTPHAVSRRGANRRRQRSRRRSARSMRRPMPNTKQPANRLCRKPPTSASRRRRNPHADAGDKLANHSIRVSVDTLDHLMTTVSELVLTRNQLLEIVRRHEDSDFKVPLQRLSNVTAELQEGVMKTRMQPIGNAWQKLPRVVRDLSAELGKADRARDGRRRNRARPSGSRTGQGSAHAPRAQLRRSRHRNPGRAHSPSASRRMVRSG